MLAKRLLIIAGLMCLAWATWIGFPLARATLSGSVVSGRIIDARTIPAGDGLMRVTAVFEYPAPNQPQAMIQGTRQANARLQLIDDPVLPTAEAVALKQQLLRRYTRRVFLPRDASNAEACIMSDFDSHGPELRQWLPMLLGIGVLLISFGLRLSSPRN